VDHLVVLVGRLLVHTTSLLELLFGTRATSVKYQWVTLRASDFHVRVCVCAGMCEFFFTELGCYTLADITVYSPRLSFFFF